MYATHKLIETPRGHMGNSYVVYGIFYDAFREVVSTSREHGGIQAKSILY